MPDVRTEEAFTVNVADNFLGVGNNFMVSAQNAIVNESGVLTRRPGVTRVGTISTGFPTEAYIILSAGVGTNRKLYIVTAAATSMQLKAWDGSNWLSGTPTFAFSGAVPEELSLCWFRENDLTENVLLSVPFFSNSYAFPIGGVGVAPPGAGLSSVVNTNPPGNIRYTINAFGRIWAAGVNVEADRDILYYTAFYSDDNEIPGNETWDQDNNWEAFGTVTGESITAISKYKQNMILVGQQKSLSVAAVGTGSQGLDLQSMAISNDIGVGSQKSVQNVGEDIYFMDQYGDLRSLQITLSESGSVVKQLPLSIPIKDQTEGINKSDLFFASGAFYKGNYWFSFKKSDGTFRLYVYNTALRHWVGPMVLKNSSGLTLQVRAMTVGWGDPGTSDLSNRSRHLYFLTHDGKASPTSASIQVYELDDDAVTDDAATAIDMEVITKANDFGFPHHDKEYRWGEITFKKKTGATGYFKLDARTERREGNKYSGFGDWIPVGSFDYTDGDDILWERFSLRSLPRSRFIQFRITCSDLLTQPEIISLLISGHAFDPEDG
ncbi:MAG: hypothetical protein ACXAEN_14840 [Candidatus Thorarchaeota archaeon]|jgi:hypothetical protein